MISCWTQRESDECCVEAYMRMHDIDREAAHDWIKGSGGLSTRA